MSYERSVMEEQEIILYAASDRRPDGELSPPEWLLWYRLRDIYRAFRGGAADKEHCAAEKARALYQFRLDNSKLAEADKINRFNAQMWVDIASAADRYALEPTIESADEFYKAVYRVERKRRDA